MKHLVIAGTGRAGTTHLVRWLAQHRLDVGPFDEDAVDPRSLGGLERRLTADSGLPYVVKDPWLFSYLHEVDPALVDVLVVPIRDLAGAAASRVRIERDAIAEVNPGWPSQVWGATPGGMLHEVTVHAQAPVLAVGLYLLVHWATVHDIPLVMLDFGRIGDDTYLEERLGEWLPC